LEVPTRRHPGRTGRPKAFSTTVTCDPLLLKIMAWDEIITAGVLRIPAAQIPGEQRSEQERRLTLRFHSNHEKQIG
jgi:hypothetical protein